MSQNSALREQPSMDEILASIRRIIDAGESQSKPEIPSEPATAAVEATIPPPPANDSGQERGRAPLGTLAQQPQTPREPDHAPEGENGGPARSDIAAAVNAYLTSENSKSGKKPELHEPVVEDAAALLPEISEFAPETLPEPDISEVEAALHAEFGDVDREVLMAEKRAKYDARFTEADDGAFRQVGSLLRGKVGEDHFAPTPTSHAPAVQTATALVSDAVSQSVSQSFSSLSSLFTEKDRPDLDAIAEDMLRPMLQDWLDNNLPSMVERLVRSEIERIARGEPRSA